MRRAAGATLLVSMLACVAPPPPSPPDLARAAQTSPPPPAARPPLPAKAEVELSGGVVAPPGQKGEIFIWVSDGECWRRGSRALGQTTANAGSWFVEVFVPQGTLLWVCAALVPQKGKPIYTATAGRSFEGRGAGEVEYRGIQLDLQPGPPVQIPHRER